MELTPAAKPSLDDNNHGKTKRLGEPFFYYLSWFLLIVVFSGFLLKAIITPEKIERITFYIVLHALVCGVWYILLVIQTGLIRRDNTQLHMKLGRLSILLSLGIVISGLLMTFDLYYYNVSKESFDPLSINDRRAAAGLIWANFSQWGLFIGMYCYAIYRRKTPACHKRWMIGSGIIMSLAGIIRLLAVVGIPGILSLLVLVGFFIAMYLYDWRAYKKIHAATVGVSLSFTLMTVSFFLFASSDWFVEFIKNTLGPV